jgi:hypothetical protein
MKEAIIKKPFSVVQWHGEDYPYYADDVEENTYKAGDKVLVLREAKPNPMGKLFVIFNERINEATVVAESYIEFVNE